jgi:hypothetical protein
MTKLIRDLLSRASSVPSIDQDEAILRLAMLLEFNRIAPSLRAGMRGQYEAMVPAEVLVDLDEDAERAILTELVGLARTSSFKPSVVWAIGRARAALGCTELLRLISEQSHIFRDPEAVWQTIAALDNCYAPRIEAVRNCYAHHAVWSFLRLAARSQDERARESAPRLIQRMEEDGITATHVP